MPKKPPPKRRQRRHGDLPAGYRWRDGRPRWDPIPARRADGWKGTDLKDAWGRWQAEGAAIERARALAAAVKAWTQGEPVSAALAHLAPAGAVAGGRAKAGGSPRSIRALMDEYQASVGFRRLAPRTQADYRGKLARMLGVIRGHAPEARFLAQDVDILLPPAFGEGGVDVLSEAYDTLRETAGESMAAGCAAALSAWMSWMVKRKRIWPTNPAAGIERVTPEGRIVVFDWPEVAALVAAAEARGLASIADAIVLAVDLSWSQQDLLALTWGQISPAGRVRHRRIKTGQAGNPPLLTLGRDRIEAIRARWRDAAVRPTHVIVCELTGRPWSADTFRHHFAAIRADVAATMPAIAGKQFRDLRDSAVTYCQEAGLDIAEICSRTLHNPTRAQAVIEKHYGAIRQSVADAGAAKLEAHFAALGYRIHNAKEGQI